jgi:protease-4
MFIDLVKTSRGERLSENNQATIFSGEFWLGTQALDLGLIDGLGDVKYVAHNIIGVTKLVNYVAKQSLFSKFTAQTAQILYGLLANNPSFLSILK